MKAPGARGREPQLRGLLAAAVLQGCSNQTALAVPAAHSGRSEVSAAQYIHPRLVRAQTDAGAPAPLTDGGLPPVPLQPGDPTLAADLPDPAPLSTRARWQYRVEYDAGIIHASAPELICSERPVTSPRKIGRFAFELWLGPELVERIRFDFPLLAAETPRPETRSPLHETPSFEPGAHVTALVSVPASERASSARILDRATRKAVDVPWPPASPGAAEPPCPPASSTSAPR